MFEVQDKFLFCQSLPNQTIKEAILKLVNDFTVYNAVKLIQSTNICSDHNMTMSGNSKGLLHTSRLAPLAVAATNVSNLLCTIHQFP
jgi:hypothetical protein